MNSLSLCLSIFKVLRRFVLLRHLIQMSMREGEYNDINAVESVTFYLLLHSFLVLKALRDQIGLFGRASMKT